MKARYLTLLFGVIALLLVVPAYIYLTYPNADEGDEALETMLPDVPIKPPPFLKGFMRYGLSKGKSIVSEFSIKAINYEVYVHRLDTNERILLLLTPHYLERSTSKVLSRDELRTLIMEKSPNLMVLELFDTHRGKVGVVLMVKLNSEEYLTLRLSRR